MNRSDPRVAAAESLLVAGMEKWLATAKREHEIAERLVAVAERERERRGARAPDGQPKLYSNGRVGDKFRERIREATRNALRAEEHALRIHDQIVQSSARNTERTRVRHQQQRRRAKIDPTTRLLLERQKREKAAGIVIDAEHEGLVGHDDEAALG